MFTRRQILSTGGAAATLGIAAAPAILRAQSWFPDYPFKLGVASGEPAPDGFVIWTKLAPEPFAPHGGMPMSAIPVKWEVASDERFATIVAKGRAPARPELGHSIHVEVSGLEPDHPYWYRFIVGSDRSMPGRTRTLPRAGTPVAALKFGVCGCQNYESGFYTAYRHLAQQEDLAFVFHYGDFIYEHGTNHAFKRKLPVAKVREHRLRFVYSLDDYRAHYAQYLLDLDLQAARSRHPFLSTFDDHEVENNWVQDISQVADVPPEVFALRRQAAMQAWYEYMPVRAAMIPHGELITANRQLHYGDLAAINLLDTRSFRSDQPCGDGFKPFCPGVADAQASVLGQAQEAWLDANLGRKNAAWTCLAQQVMMMPLDRRRHDEKEKILNLDSWAGYDAPRNRLMSRLARIDDAVVLTGDEHQNFAGLLYDKDKPVAAECVITSISSGGDGRDVRPGSDKMLANNPQLKFTNDQRGYALCEVTPEAWKTHYMVVDKVSQPGGKISKRATAIVARGEVSLAIA